MLGGVAVYPLDYRTEIFNDNNINNNHFIYIAPFPLMCNGALQRNVQNITNNVHKLHYIDANNKLKKRFQLKRLKYKRTNLIKTLS